MPGTAKLLLPRTELAGCIFAAIVRDTREVALCDEEKFNFFPASPLVTVTRVLHGESRVAPSGGDAEEARFGQQLAPITLSGPQTKPVISWNPGPVFAVTVGFYPDAWMTLTGASPEAIAEQTTTQVPEKIAELMNRCLSEKDIERSWADFEDAIEPIWRKAKEDTGQPILTGSNRIADWSKSLVAQMFVSAPGRSLRAIQRRLKHWTGQNNQTLSFFARIENLHELVTKNGASQPAGLANEAGFSDQSHMGRSVVRATGFSLVRLNELIKSNEAFWCYRLLGERF